MSSAFAATSTVPAYNPADWHNDERRAKAQRQERHHIADYYARSTGSKRNVKIEKRGNVSPRASARGRKAVNS
jgi:hypothetical protein